MPTHWKTTIVWPPLLAIPLTLFDIFVVAQCQSTISQHGFIGPHHGFIISYCSPMCVCCSLPFFDASLQFFVITNMALSLDMMSFERNILLPNLKATRVTLLVTSPKNQCWPHCLKVHYSHSNAFCVSFFHLITTLKNLMTY
jgi:hypothetical protein